MAVDFDTMAARSRGRRRAARREADSAHLTCPRGTDFTLDLSGRAGHRRRRRPDRGRRVRQPARAARASSPRSAARDTIVASSLAPLGLSDEPAVLTVATGRIVGGRRAGSGPSTSSGCAPTATPGTNLAELGVGTNDRAKLTGNVLEDEKILGTAHVAFGASAGIGGTVSVPIHLDVVVIDADPRGRRHAGARRRALGARHGVTPLLAVPNVSEGRDEDAIDAIARRVRRAPARRPLRPRPPPHRVHARRRGRGARARRSSPVRARPASASTSTATGTPPPRRRARRRADRLPGDADRGARVRRGAGARRSARQRARAPGLPLRRARGRAHARGAAARRAGRARASGSRDGELRPDFGPPSLHPTAGAVLVAARPPLVAFNVELAPAGDARGRPSGSPR